MFNKKTIVILVIILIGLIVSIICVSQNKGFKPPKFDENAKVYKSVPDEQKVLRINDNYAFYVDGAPKVKDNNIYINFYSLTSDNIYLKIRILQDDVIIAESGLIKSNEWIETVKMINKPSSKKKVKFLIMSYEKDTYYSMGEVTLNSQMEVK